MDIGALLKEKKVQVQSLSQSMRMALLEWHSVLDHFRLNVANRSSHDQLTKRALVAKTYDVLGWFIIKVKIMLQSRLCYSTVQKVWESKVGWDEVIPQEIAQEWSVWSSQLKSLSQLHIPDYFNPTTWIQRRF